MNNPFHSFVLASSLKRIQSRHSLVVFPEPVNYYPNYNIRPGNHSWVITNDSPKLFQLFGFGLKGLPAIQPFLRAEGKRNQDDDPNYNGSNAIFLQPGIKKLIRFRRCLVLADAFITGPPESPFLVYLLNKQRPFCFAGIWNHTKAEETDSDVFSFAIITTVTNPFIASLGTKRMPVILEPKDELTWLKSSQLSDILRLLHPYPEEKMNAYPVSPFLDDSSNVFSVIQPKGDPLRETASRVDLSRNRRDKHNFSGYTFAERRKA